MKCRRCGTENDARTRFCGRCGAPLALASAGLGSTEAGLVRPVTQRGAAEGERKLVTVLFADVAGFTTLAETLDPEPLRDLINACFDRLVPCVERYGGTVDKFIGDEIMALCGAPVAHENDAERAVRAALDMRAALAEFNAEQGTDLQAHFGLNTGLVLAGCVGAGSRTEYSVMGDAVNVASRLAETAAPGEMLVGPDTYRRAGHLFQCEEAGPLQIRGRAETLTVYRVLGTRTSAGPVPTRAGRFVDSPLVGRDREKQAFVAALDRTLQGEGGILGVMGDAGLGKSRLTAEVRRLVGPELTWLEGRALSFGRQLSYWPFLELLQSAAGIDSDDDEAERSCKLERLITRLFAEETPGILPYLATFLALPVPEELQDKVRYLDGEAMGRQVFRTMRLFVARLAEERPAVLVFEDVHWLDASSVALLEHLLPLTREASVLFCLVGRPESDSPTLRLQALAAHEYAERHAEIPLNPLTLSQTQELVANLVGHQAIPVALRESIDRKAEGNPFFVEEIIRALIDLGGIVATEGGGWRLTEKAQEIHIPDTLQGVIMARIDRLDEELKAVLRMAAVVGRSFFYRVLAALTEAEERLDRDLVRLQSLELIREKAREPELEYIFKHVLVQEAIYESILLQRRRELHRRVGEAIENFFAERLDEFYGLLAYHYSRAEDWEKAQDYLLKAGDQAGSIAADAEALAHYERAIEAHAKAFGDTWDPFQRAKLERKMGEAFYRRGENERARGYLYRAMEYLGYPLPASSRDLRRAMVAQILRQVSHRVVPRTSAPVAGEALQRVEEMVKVVDLLLFVDTLFEPIRGLFSQVLGLNICERAGYEYGMTLTSAGLGAACDFAPAPGIAGHYHRRALALAQRQQQPHALSRARFMGGLHAHFAGAMDAAIEHYAAAAELSLALGDTSYWGAPYGMTGELEWERGEFEHTFARGREMVRRGEESGDRLLQAWGEMYLGESLDTQGLLAEAEVHQRAAMRHLLDSTELNNGSRSAGRLAHCLIRQGRVEEAKAIVAEVRQLMDDHSLRSHFCRSVRTADATLCLLALEQAEPGDRAVALEQAKTACRNLLKHGKGDKGAFVAGFRMQGTYEWLRGRERKARSWWQKSLDLAPQVGSRYQEAQTRLEIGRRLGDRVELERAEAMFAEMGAALDLEEARQLLGIGEALEDMGVPVEVGATPMEPTAAASGVILDEEAGVAP